MYLTVKKEREQTTQKVFFQKKTLGELLNQLNINPETVIAVKNNIVITEDEELKENETIELLSVISGG